MVYDNQRGVVALPDPECYQWKISPKQDLAHLEVSSTIISKIFTLFGIKWYFMLVPKPNKKAQQIKIYLGIADFASNDIQEIEVHLTYNSFNDTVSSHQFNKNKHLVLLDCTIYNNQFHIEEELIFDLEMVLISVYDNDGNPISSKYIDQLLEEKKDENDDGNDFKCIQYECYIPSDFDLEIFESRYYIY